jgi:hypothetical protein
MVLYRAAGCVDVLGKLRSRDGSVIPQPPMVKHGRDVSDPFRRGVRQRAEHEVMILASFETLAQAAKLFEQAAAIDYQMV